MRDRTLLCAALGGSEAIVYCFRHLNTLDDPLARTKWMNVKKAIMEETEVVKQLDAERRAFKEAPTGRRAASPPINTKSSFVFQPLDEYPTSSGGPMDDPDVWRPPTRDVTSRRPSRAGQSGMRKSPQDGAWARGPTTRTGPASRGGRGGATSKSTAGARPSTAGKKGAASKSTKAESTVSYMFLPFGIANRDVNLKFFNESFPCIDYGISISITFFW